MSYKIISKFIKDISFEIPDARTFVMLEKEISKYNLNFDIKSKPFKENIIEVNTILSLVPNQDVKHKILTEINLATLISIEKKLKDKKELEKIILITLPTEIYPILYETFVYLFSQAGVKNIIIKKLFVIFVHGLILDHVLMEHRSGLIVKTAVTPADGHGERDAALVMIAGLARRHRVTVAADKGYDTRDFVAGLRSMTATPHIAQHTTRRRSAI
ncbi:MAG: hypothetical protein COC18_02680, partial [Pelagibacteraceae bacterium]